MTRYFLRVADHTIDKESCLPLKMKAFISVQNAEGSDNNLVYRFPLADFTISRASKPVVYD